MFLVKINNLVFEIANRVIIIVHIIYVIYFFVLLSFFTYESTVVIHVTVMLPVSFVMKFAKLYLNNDDKNQIILLFISEHNNELHLLSIENQH